MCGRTYPSCVAGYISLMCDKAYIHQVWQDICPYCVAGHISLLCGMPYIPLVCQGIYPSCVVEHISLLCGRAYISPVWQGIYPSCVAGHISLMCDRLIPVSIMLPPWQGLYPSCAACHIGIPHVWQCIYLLCLQKNLRCFGVIFEYDKLMPSFLWLGSGLRILIHYLDTDPDPAFPTKFGSRSGCCGSDCCILHKNMSNCLGFGLLKSYKSGSVFCILTRGSSY